MQTKLYHCAACGYRADVLGGSDRNREITLKTMVCRACKAVVDVPVAAFVPGEAPPDQPGNCWQDIAAKCPLCGGSDVMPWALHRPCPRCEGDMDSGV